MNNQQRKYALQRAQEITSAALASRQAEHESKNVIPAVKLSDKEKRSLIRKGKVKIVSEGKIPSGYFRNDMDRLFDFSPFESEQTYKNQTKHDSDMFAISKAGSAAADSIMLGDAQAALDAIDKLSAALAAI